MKVKRMSVKDGKFYNIEQFPNFSVTGSIKGMKEKYYGKDALLIRCGSYIYYVGNLHDNFGECMPYGEYLYFHRAK